MLSLTEQSAERRPGCLDGSRYDTRISSSARHQAAIPAAGVERNGGSGAPAREAPATFRGKVDRRRAAAAGTYPPMGAEGSSTRSRSGRSQSPACHAGIGDNPDITYARHRAGALLP